MWSRNPSDGIRGRREVGNGVWSVRIRCRSKRCCVVAVVAKWEDVWIEFEFKSSHFKAHNHDINECDVIVCWEHDWKDCPIEVIELRTKIMELRQS